MLDAAEEQQRQQEQIVCQHCQIRGQVTARQVKRAKRISGTRLVGGMLTGGGSLLATGVTKKHPWVTEMHCRNCGMRWDVA